MRQWIALLAIGVLMAACDQAPSGVAVKPSQVQGANIDTQIELQTASVASPKLVGAMAEAIGTVARQVQSGKVRPGDAAGIAAFHFSAINGNQTKSQALITLRLPVAALRSGQTGTAYLEQAVDLIPGSDPEAMSAAFAYCDTNASANPKFCQLVANHRAGGD